MYKTIIFSLSVLDINVAWIVEAGKTGGSVMSGKRNWDVLIMGGASGSGKTSISLPLARYYGIDLVRVSASKSRPWDTAIERVIGEVE